jgi:hypothetical protein
MKGGVAGEMVSSTVITFGVAIPFLPFLMLEHGQDAVIPVGTVVDSFVDGDVEVKLDSLTADQQIESPRTSVPGAVIIYHPNQLYVPPDVTVELGDIVEVRMGRESTKTDPGAVNVAVRVREKQGAPDSQCSWDPPNNTMWRRLLYCKWMPAEGWTKNNGFYNTWLKRADATGQ